MESNDQEQEAAEAESYPGAFLWQQGKELLLGLEALAPILPQLLRLLALAPRAVHIAHSAVEAVRSRATTDEVVAQIGREAFPWTDALREQAASAIEEVWARDKLLVEAAQQLQSAMEKAASDPKVRAALQRLADRIFAQFDKGIAFLMDSAMEGKSSPTWSRGVEVTEKLIQRVLQRMIAKNF